ncbi:hypothetical protein CAPTEDRAFT_63132, partial [Capitella teleta]
TYIYVTVTFFYLIVFVFGVIGNIIVIYVICALKDMRTPTNIFLLNLCFADLLVIIVCMPSSLVEFHTHDVWYLGSFMCKLTPFLEHSVSHTSSLTILAISFERYYAICSPLEVLYSCTKRRSLIIISVVWVCGLASALPMIFFTFTVEAAHSMYGDVDICVTPIEGVLRISYVLSTISAFFIIPCAILVVLYAMICRRLIGDANPDQQRSPMPLAHNPRAQHTRRQIIYMLITIIILFFVCLLPFRVVTLWAIFSDKSEQAELGLEGTLNLFSFARVMFYLNSAGNPILYNIMSTKFREACRRALSCC